MARKKKRRFRASTEVRAMARERLGSPRPSRVIPDVHRKKEKHPKRLREEED